MIGVCCERSRSRIKVAVSKPSMPGILTSIKIAAKSLSSRQRRHSNPERALTIFCPRFASVASSATKLLGWSSTSKTLTFGSTEGTSLVNSSVKLFVAVILLIAVLAGGELDGLLVAQAQEAGQGKALVQQFMDLSGQQIIEINQDVSAQDDLELVEGAVGYQVVLREHNVVNQSAVKDDVAVIGPVVFGKTTRAAGLEVIGRVLLNQVGLKDAGLGLGQDRLIHVRRVDAAPRIEPLLMQQDGHGI